jgi:PAS domain S-box-containing protein
VALGVPDRKLLPQIVELFKDPKESELSAGGLQPLLEEVLQAVMELQGADFGHVQLLNGQTGALDIVAQRGFDQLTFLDEAAAVQERKAPCGRALERRARVVIEDVEADPECAPYRSVAAAAGFRAVQATPLFDRAGQPLVVFSTHFRQPHRPTERELRLTDLYARQAAEVIALGQAEQALRASDERLRQAVQIDTVGVLFFMTDGRITQANDAFLRMSGYSRQELVQGQVRWDEMTPPEWMPASRQAVAEFEATGRTRPYEKEYVRKDGTRWWGLFAATRVGPDEGVEYVIDVSEQKRANERLRASEAALRASEERLRFAAQAAGFGWYDLDLVTGQAYRSPEYKALFGLSQDDEFQLDADQVPIYVHPDDRSLVREATRESRDPRGSGAKDVEYRVLLPDGAVRWLLVRGRVSFEGAGRARRPVRSRGIALDVTGRKQLEQEILEISGREQRRIGHDLHDDLCQRLGGLQLLIGVLEKDLVAAGNPQAPQAGRIEALVHEALERARLLARGLAPVAIEEGGLASALQELADNAAQLFDLRCEFRGESVGLADAGAATHLYRIAQEAITNAAKHGRAERVVISLTDAGDCFELKVVDDGKGFARPMAGMGLRIMKYRAAMLGATLDVQSAAGRGTTVTCAFGKGLCSATPAKARLRVGRNGRQVK